MEEPTGTEFPKRVEVEGINPKPMAALILALQFIVGFAIFYLLANDIVNL